MLVDIQTNGKRVNNMAYVQKVRYKKQMVNFNSAPQSFKTAIQVWDPKSIPTGIIAAKHPRSQIEPWDYTVTFQWTVQMRTVRAHVHYTKQQSANAQNPSYTAGPGYCWISGIKDYDAKTPQALVNAQNNLDPEAQITKQNFENSGLDANFGVGFFD